MIVPVRVPHLSHQRRAEEGGRVPGSAEHRRLLAPDSDLVISLIAMGEYQDRRRANDGDHAYPAMVMHDWAFHERRTGFDRAKIRRLLSQLVSAGLADDLARHSGTGEAFPGMRAAEGCAWISDEGQLVLSNLLHLFRHSR